MIDPCQRLYNFLLTCVSAISFFFLSHQMLEALARIERTERSGKNQPIKWWYGNGLNSIYGITPRAVNVSGVLRYKMSS